MYRFGKIKDPVAITQIRELKPDVIFVWGLSQLVPSDILSIPSIGCIGVHPALLPRNRGRHPIIWALVEGLTESGLTFFYMDEGADSGDILWQKAFPISLDDDAATLYQKIEILASEAISQFLPQLQNGTAPRIPQDHTKATYWRKRGEADGLIDWRAPSLRTYNLIRALIHPYVGAHTLLNGRKVIVWRAKLAGQTPATLMQASPGTVVRCSTGSILVRTGDGFLELADWQTVESGGLDLGVKFDPLAGC
jgi:methionyl-tRNA formyltransferase